MPKIRRKDLSISIKTGDLNRIVLVGEIMRRNIELGSRPPYYHSASALDDILREDSADTAPLVTAHIRGVTATSELVPSFFTVSDVDRDGHIAGIIAPEDAYPFPESFFPVLIYLGRYALDVDESGITTCKGVALMGSPYLNRRMPYATTEEMLQRRDLAEIS